MMQIGVTCRTQLRRPSSKLYVLKKSAFGKGWGGHGCRWGWGGRAGPSGHPGLLLPPLRHPTVEKQPVQPGVLPARPPCTAGEAVGAPPPPSSPRLCPQSAAGAGPGPTSPFPVSTRDSAEGQRHSRFAESRTHNVQQETNLPTTLPERLCPPA